MSQESNGVSRRNLLTHGAVLAGAGVALSATASQAAAATEETPNLNPPVVQVQGGKLRGFRDGPTFTFLGVPYAQAERFGPPQPVAPWSDIKGAQTFGPVCPIPQQTSVGIDDFVFPHRYWVENENCQVLNIWTQNLTPSVKKPVMVWMHGGGFTNGSAMESYAYDGKTLSEFGDVVVVSVNHRLNIIGTLDLSAYGAAYADSRNTGMADLVASLRWVHDNIATFGGDPGNVTIDGESAGGACIALLITSPRARGLFQRAIGESLSIQSAPRVGMRLQRRDDACAIEGAKKDTELWFFAPSNTLTRACIGTKTRSDSYDSSCRYKSTQSWVNGRENSLS